MKARYKAVVDRYAQAIRSGQLPAGSRLPTHRTLAAGERISLATATRVYRELEEMGLVSGETGRGTFVRDLSLPPGHGVDQQVVAADVVDLNFNYPSLPEQGDALREALSVSQTEMARQMGIAQPSVAAIEQRGNEMKISTLKRYVEALGGTVRLDVELPDGQRFGFTL